MKLQKEEDILLEDFRAMVIEEINGEENILRKKESKKKYDAYKDGIKQFVIERMNQELSPETFKEIEQRTANVSIYRKIIDKKARVFKDGAKREVPESVEGAEAVNNAVAFYVDELNHQSKMKKVNKYVELEKNCSYFITPYKDHMSELYKIKSQVLLPHLYDVIEDTENPEMPRVYIFSYYSTGVNVEKTAKPNESGLRSPRVGGMDFRQGDMVDQTIADAPSDGGAGEMMYIWWSNKYHFTTNSKGQIIEGKQAEDLSNPIGMLPIVNYAKDQDGQFWAIGGDDLLDGAILINLLLTDMYFIAKLQGMGIFYVFGPDIPKSLKIGPSDAIIGQKKEGDPDTQIGFASSSPPLAEHMRMIEQYVALLLSTNNLEPGTVRGELSATTASSGIQELIKMSENVDDIEDQRELYRDNEPKIFQIIAAWHNELLERNVLHPDNAQFGMLPENKVQLKFIAADRFMTDKDKLDIIERRRQLGLDSMIDSLIMDNPDLGRTEAEEKLKQLIKEKIDFMRMKMLEQVTVTEDDNAEMDSSEGKEENETSEGETEAEEEEKVE